MHKKDMFSFVVIECSLMLHIFYVATLTINLCRIKINVKTKKPWKDYRVVLTKHPIVSEFLFFYHCNLCSFEDCFTLFFYSFKIMLQDVENIIFYCVLSPSFAPKYHLAFLFHFVHSKDLNMYMMSVCVNPHLFFHDIVFF